MTCLWPLTRKVTGMQSKPYLLQVHHLLLWSSSITCTDFESILRFKLCSALLQMQLFPLRTDRSYLFYGLFLLQGKIPVQGSGAGGWDNEKLLFERHLYSRSSVWEWAAARGPVGCLCWCQTTISWGNGNWGPAFAVCCTLGRASLS